MELIFEGHWCLGISNSRRCPREDAFEKEYKIRAIVTRDHVWFS